MQTYTLTLGLAIVLSIGILLLTNRHEAKNRVIDLAIGALIGGLIAARAGHVLLQLDYFTTHPAEILHYERGGLNWHGAVIGGLVGLWFAARLRKIALTPLLDSLALIFPLVMLAGWRGCMGASCAYGSEITRMAAYPAWLVWETADSYGLIAPRYATQLIGALLALCLLALAILLHRRNWLPGQRFWFILVLASIGMFGIGFLRGDSMLKIAELRLDQWLDLLLIILSFSIGWWTHPLHRKTRYDTKQVDLLSES